jgi:tetratricopeptide (TPR) repeat protein/transglutaminase-like putative cysteine protease
MKLGMAIAAIALCGTCALRPVRCAAQEATKAANASPADYSAQAAVVNDVRTSIVFHDDGTSTTTRQGIIKVQSQAGVQSFGVLHFPYASATTTMQLVYMRVIKPDKSVVVTPAENVLDMPAEITREAPFYSDLKDLQVAVKGLETGDVLEFEWRADTTKPLDPGEFWTAFEFMRNAIVLHEQLQITVPSDRKITVKSATVQPTIAQSGANRVYTWETKNLTVKSAKELAAEDEPKPADVQVTSFQNWDELGKWFGGLVAPRAAPTAEIKAKADELTRDARTQSEKIQDLYAFVATKYRYIGIGLGIGRYQPHEAADVLSNDYGDCKDKHTLLQALLAAEGIQAYPALINSSAKIDEDVPSPGQFDHVITAIPQGKGYLFLDSTPEVGPFGYLTANLRDKWALVIPASGAAQLVKTPIDPPFQQYFHFQADGSLDDSGRLTSKMQLTFRDDSELVFRLAFRQAGQPQWNDVMQKISGNLGFGGTVSNTTLTPPDETQTPFHIAYDYKRENYSDWSEKQIGPPFPPIYITPVPDEAAEKTKPLKIGSPEESDYTATIKLPADLPPSLPAAVHLSTPFGTYDATYTYASDSSGGVLRAERKLVTRVREIAVSDFDAYGKFVKGIQADEQRFIPLGGGAESNTSADPEAVRLYNQGRQAAQLRDLQGAIDYFQQSVDKDPKFALGWTALGMMHAASGSRSEAEDELKKAIALDPSQATPYEALGSLLIMQRRFEDALAIWKQLEKEAPSNVTVVERVGGLLLQLKRYPEAVTELEGAVKKNPGDNGLLTQLGVAYARSGNGDEAVSTFETLMKNDQSANTLNTVAYEMADDKLNVPEALKYAQEAVSKEEATTAKIDVDHADPEDFASASRLAAYWDTLGWAYFRSGDMERAEKYLNAGWHLSQDPTIADHLGQLYEKVGKKRQAIEAYESAEATHHAPDNSDTRLRALGASSGYSSVSLQDLRIVQLAISPKPKEHVNAEFVVALSADGKATAKFVSGSDELRDRGKSLGAAAFKTPFPDAGPAIILRRGILDCEPELPHCSFAMYPLNFNLMMPAQPTSTFAPETQNSRTDSDSITLTRRRGDSNETQQSGATKKSGPQ